VLLDGNVKTVKKKTCQQCDSIFSCGTSDVLNAKSTQDSVGCWCNAYPSVMQIKATGDCYCPECLRINIAKEINRYLEETDFAQAKEMAKRFQNNKKLIEGIDYTIEQNNTVFTQWYLMKRGYCCGNGCRHCPYPKD